MVQIYSHVKIIYIILSLINIGIMVFYGNKISNSKSYWKWAVYPIISYTLYMGLRFGRMIDYNLYCARYYDLGKNITAGDYELGFSALCYILNLCNIPYQCFILLTSFLLIFCIMLFLKDYKKAMPYMLLLFMWEAINAENFIRWYLAISVFLIYVYYLRREDRKFMYFAVLAPLMHIGLLPVVFIFYFLKKLNLSKVSPVIYQLLFIASVSLGTVEMLGILSPYVSILGFDERSATYAEQFDSIIAGEWGYIGKRDNLAFSTQIRQIMAYSFPLYIIPQLVRENKLKNIDANAYYIGILISPVFKQVEILDRISSAFLIFSIIVSGYSYYYTITNRKKISKILLYFCYFSLFSNVYPIFSEMFSRNKWYLMLFIWDSMGEESLPIFYFLKN